MEKNKLLFGTWNLSCFSGVWMAVAGSWQDGVWTLRGVGLGTKGLEPQRVGSLELLKRRASF